MSLSDCPRCWDTPCTCGHMGYTVVYHKGSNSINERMDKLEAENAALKVKIARLDKLEAENAALKVKIARLESKGSKKDSQ